MTKIRCGRCPYFDKEEMICEISSGKTYKDIDPQEFPKLWKKCVYNLVKEAKVKPRREVLEKIEELEREKGKLNMLGDDVLTSFENVVRRFTNMVTEIGIEGEIKALYWILQEE